MCIWMQVFSIRNEEKAHHFDPSIPSSAKEMLPHKTLCGYATSLIQERRTDESEHATWLSKGSKGPPNIQTDSKRYVHLGCTQGPTCQTPGQRRGWLGPTRGQNRGFGRTTLVAPHLSLPRGGLPLVLSGFLGVHKVIFGSKQGVVHL
jgi:hypothetical protein